MTRRPWYLSAFGAGILWKLLFNRSSDKYISTSPASTQRHLLFSRVLQLTMKLLRSGNSMKLESEARARA